MAGSLQITSYSEVELMAAEAALKGWISSDPETHFKAGVIAAINKWTAFDRSFARTPAEIDAYIILRAAVLLLQAIAIKSG
ncbi:hypothetical protein BH20BAC1_BH20BAC1_12880 [soil metagenome]